MPFSGGVGYGQSNPLLLNQPSDAIFGNAAYNEILNGQGVGYSAFSHFFDNQSNIIASATSGGFPYPNLFTASTGAGFVADTVFDTAVQLITGTVSNAFVQTWNRPTVPVSQGNQHWFEVLIGLSDITNAKGVFVGIGNTFAIVPTTSSATNGLIQAASATKNSNILGNFNGSCSFAGFWMHGDVLTNFDAVIGNQIGTLGVTPTTVNNTLTPGQSGSSAVILSNVLTAAQNNPNPGSLTGNTPVVNGSLSALITASQVVSGSTLTPQQCLTQLGVVASSAAGATGFVKLGIRYDGQQYLYWYVNGVQIAKYNVTPQTFDTVSTFGPVVAVQAAAVTAITAKLDFFKYASRTSN